MHHLLTDMAVAIVVGALLANLAHFLKQPSILAYLAAGALLGPGIGFGLIHETESIQVIAEVGLVLLLFILGLELDVRALLRSGKELLIGGVGQYVVCVGLGLALFFSFEVIPGPALQPIYLACLCGLSSTAIVVKLLDDKFELHSRAGKVALAVLVLQDLWAILFLALQPNLSTPQFSLFVAALAKAGVLVAIGYLCSKYLLSKLFERISRSPELVVTTALGWCGAMAILGGYLGLSKEMGALIAGVTTAAFPHRLHVTAQTLPLRDFFLTLFFMSLGMQMVSPNGAVLFAAVVIALFTMVSRLASVYPLLLIAGSGHRTGFITSLNLMPLGEFSLVIATIGLQYGHVTTGLVTALMYGMVISCLLSTYAIKYSSQIFAAYAHLFRLDRPRDGSTPSPATVSDHGAHRDIVILGYYHVGRELVQRLTETDPALLQRVVVIDFTTEALKRLEGTPVKTLFGDLSRMETLSHAELKHASIIICTLPNVVLKGVTNLGLVSMCRALAPDATIIGMADTESERQELLSNGASEALNIHADLAEALLQGLHTNSAKGEALPQPV